MVSTSAQIIPPPNFGYAETLNMEIKLYDSSVEKFITSIEKQIITLYSYHENLQTT